jgi:hypothetical protein
VVVPACPRGHARPFHGLPHGHRVISGRNCAGVVLSGMSPPGVRAAIGHRDWCFLWTAWRVTPGAWATWVHVHPWSTKVASDRRDERPRLEPRIQNAWFVAERTNCGFC